VGVSNLLRIACNVDGRIECDRKNFCHARN
jgi:hypothetical protein